MPGQEILKNPSSAYLVVAKLVQIWIHVYENTGIRLDEKKFVGQFMERYREFKGDLDYLYL